MLEGILTRFLIFYAMGVTAGLGGISKLISQITLRKMVKAASEIGTSNHRLMKLVKAKFEHASMASDRVQNVEAFVSKYLFEYKVFGIRFHLWRNVIKKSVWVLGALGAIGMALSYQCYGFGEMVFQYGAWTGVGITLLFLIHISTDDEYYLQITENYIVDYLENVCMRRYAKANEEKKEVEPVEMPLPEVEEMPVQEKPEIPKTISKEDDEQEKRIRQILEEFLA